MRVIATIQSHCIGILVYIRQLAPTSVPSSQSARFSAPRSSPLATQRADQADDARHACQSVNGAPNPALDCRQGFKGGDEAEDAESKHRQQQADSEESKH